MMLWYVPKVLCSPASQEGRKQPRCTGWTRQGVVLLSCQPHTHHPHVLSTFLCPSACTSWAWWTWAAGGHLYWIPCRCWTPRMLFMHWILMVVSCWESTLRYLYIGDSCMNFGHAGNLLCCLQHIWALENRGFSKNCVFNKAAYCEHVRNVLRCFHWLPLRFEIRIRELVLRFSCVPHCLICQQRHTSLPCTRCIKRCGRDLLLTTLLWKIECSILRGNLIPMERITFSRADLTLEWTPEI